MLRYKVYAVVTHPKFPVVAFYLSLLLYCLGWYALCNPGLISKPAYLNSNAYNPTYQSALIDNYVSSKSMKEFIQWNGTDVYYAHIRAPRTIGKDCLVLLFSYGQGRIGEELALSIKRYMESQTWGGDLLIILYKNEPYAKSFRNFYNWAEGRFGVFRGFFDFDISEPYSYITISGEGMNGIQTDLDQVEIVNIIASKSGLHYTYPIPVKNLIENLEYSLRTWINLLDGNVHNPHSYLLNRNQHAIKIYSSLVKRRQSLDPLAVLKLIEMIIRSFTSCEEKLHFGIYFFYYSAPKLIVPLSHYAYILVSFAVALMFQATLILREHPWEAKGAIFTLWPYFIGYLVYKLILPQCGNDISSVKLLLLLLGIIPCKKTLTYKAYSNLALSTSIAIMGISNFPIGLFLAIIVPFKILIKPYRSVFILSLLLGIILALSLQVDFKNIAEVESCSGHRLLGYALIALFPNICHILNSFA
ncbi:hypothetical protein SteCoe_32520 [Stentor coeruleus]|uniref:Uncharacterized protein n=1 Tax=Stentor coeruleus TaxID=5963 RepID=A0A1R2AYT6_9CILI|nr:hypothetical protein SteCoe_32520 [Stentor coeruleus]